MMNPIKAWNIFWFRPISARPLGVFRVVIGVLALANIGLIAFESAHWLSDQGLMTASEARELAGPLRFSPLLWGASPTTVHSLLAALAVVAALFIVGWQTRVVSIVLYAGMLTIHHRMITVNSGADALLMTLLFYLVLSPCGAAYSFDARRARRKRGGTLAEPLILPWSQRLIQFQLALVYFNAALLKCRGTTWFNGTALHYALNLPEVDLFDFTWLSHYPVVLNAMSHGALFLEFALPFLLWFRVTRGWAILSGIAFHLSILFMINAPLFGEMMIACYLTFLPPDEFDRILGFFKPIPSRRTNIPGRIDAPSPVQRPHLAEPEHKSTKAVGYDR